MRYLAAFIVSSLLVATLLAYHWLVASKVNAVLRQVQAQDRQAGLPPETTPGDLGVLMPKDLITLVEIDHLILRFWFVVLPLILSLCFCVAALFPRKHGKAESPPTSSLQVDPHSDLNL